MISIFPFYFRSLSQRFLLLCFVNSFIPLILLSYQYDFNTSLKVFQDSIFSTLPWFLLFQQIILGAFVIPKDFIHRLYFLIITSILSTVIILLSFPLTQTDLQIEFNKITPNITQPKNSVILSDQGTLIIDPLNSAFPLYATSNSKALLINSNFFSFDSIKTNSQSFELSQASSFASYGFQKQNGIAIIPFTRASSKTNISLGQQLLQHWLNSVYKLNHTIQELYRIVNIPVKLSKSIYYKKIHTQKEARSFNNINKNIFHEYRQLVNSSTEKIVKSNSPINVTLLDYLILFSSFLSISSLFSLIGIAISIRQHLTGVLAISILLAFFIPSISTSFFQLSLTLSKMLPSFSILLINLILTTVFYSLSILLYILKGNRR